MYLNTHARDIMLLDMGRNATMLLEGFCYKADYAKKNKTFTEDNASSRLFQNRKIYFLNQT